MPDNKSLYAKLNNIYKIDSHPLNNEQLINSAELRHAKLVVHQLMETTISSLNGMKNLNSMQVENTHSEIKHVITHTLARLHNTVYSKQLVSIINKAKFKMHKIVILMRFINIMNLVIVSVRQAPLAKSQKDSAISSIKFNYRFFKNNLLKAQISSSFQGIFTSGINGMNGSLASYISDSQVYILNQLETMINRIKDRISKQRDLSIMAKYLAYRDINLIRDDVQNNVMMTTNFMALRRIYQRCTKRLKLISNDQGRVLSNLTDFTHFTNYLTSVVGKLPQLSADLRLNLETKIDKYQRNILANLQRNHKNNVNQILEHKKRYLVQIITRSVSRGYQHSITEQTPDLNKKQRQVIVNHIKQSTEKIVRKFQPQSSFKGSIEENLVNDLKQFHRNIFIQRNNLIYYNQINQLINDFTVKINEVYDLSATDKKQLKLQVSTFGHYVKAQSDHKSISGMRIHLQKLLDQQIKYIKQSTLHRQMKDLYQQVQFSHLKLDQKHYLQQRLSNIKRDSHSNYNDKRLLIKDVQNYGISLDKSENLKRLTKLNNVIYRQVKDLDISVSQGQNLSHDFAYFNREISNANQILMIDHIEQKYEDHIYGQLYHPNVQISALKVEALRFPINQANEAHRRINLSILQPRFSRLINDRINHNLNTHLYVILRSHDVHEIKQQLIRITKEIHHILSQSLVLLRKEYINNTNNMTKDIYHQVIIYPSAHHALDRTEAIGSHVSNALNNASDLLHIECANQQGRRRLIHYANKVIGQIDSSKALSHRKVEKMMKMVLKQLKDDDTESASDEVTLASRNRILKITNHCNNHINRASNKELLDYCHHCYRSLNRILRQNCLQEWLRIIEQAKLRIQKLYYIPIDPRMKSLYKIQQCGLRVANQIKGEHKGDLYKILQKNKSYVHQIIRNSVYLDPTKKQARDNLNKVVIKVKNNIKKFTSSETSKKALTRLDELDMKIDEQIMDAHDKDVKSIYHRSTAKISNLGLKLIKNAEFKRFDRNTKSLEKRIHQQPVLGDKEFSKIDTKFNISYHKSIFEIKRADDINNCITRERHGEKVIKNILTHSKMLNGKKEGPYSNITADVTDAKSQISSLHNLQQKDKKDSYNLLDQINDQIKHNIKESVGADNASKALKKGHSMVQQVIDKVSSAGVLVSAIKTANKQIANSTLGRKQKKATLRQINQIIDNGIRSQFTNSHVDDKGDGKSSEPKKTISNKHNVNKNKKDTHYKKGSHKHSKFLSIFFN